jgi:hypothetical protein
MCSHRRVATRGACCSRYRSVGQLCRTDRTQLMRIRLGVPCVKQQRTQWHCNCSGHGGSHHSAYVVLCRRRWKRARGLSSSCRHTGCVLQSLPIRGRAVQDGPYIQLMRIRLGVPFFFEVFVRGFQERNRSRKKPRTDSSKTSKKSKPDRD